MPPGFLVVPPVPRTEPAAGRLRFSNRRGGPAVGAAGRRGCKQAVLRCCGRRLGFAATRNNADHRTCENEMMQAHGRLPFVPTILARYSAYGQECKETYWRQRKLPDLSFMPGGNVIGISYASFQSHQRFFWIRWKVAAVHCRIPLFVD